MSEEKCMITKPHTCSFKTEALAKRCQKCEKPLPPRLKKFCNSVCAGWDRNRWARK